jgi:hypothetical protein
MRAAINLEAIFALLSLAGIVLRPSASTRAAGSSPSRWPLLLLLAVPAAFLWTLAFPLVSDDFVHIGFALHFTASKIPELFTVPAGDHFFRPLGYIAYAIDALWAGHNPALWHLATLFIHFANCLLVYLVARQTGLARFFAVTAAILFGIHGSRPEAVTWIACRFDLISTLFVLATLALYLRWAKQPSRWIYSAALVTCFLALISKEAAYVLPLLLVLITPRPRWRAAAPFACLTAAVFLYRWHLLSGIGGYQTGANTPAILNFSILRTLNALFLRLWATLFFPINWTESPQWWLSAAILLGIAAYAILAWHGRRTPRSLAFLGFAFIAALPVEQLLLIGTNLEKSRVLYLPSVGFALFLASVIEDLRKSAWRIPVAIGLIAFQTACLEHNLITWRGVSLVAQQACDSVAAALQQNGKSVTVLDLPNDLRGVYFFHKGMPDCLEVGHGIDIHRVRDSNADLVFRWDPQTEAVAPVKPAQ